MVYTLYFACLLDDTDALRLWRMCDRRFVARKSGLLPEVQVRESLSPVRRKLMVLFLVFPGPHLYNSFLIIFSPCRSESKVVSCPYKMLSSRYVVCCMCMYV